MVMMKGNIQVGRIRPYKEETEGHDVGDSRRGGGTEDRSTVFFSREKNVGGGGTHLWYFSTCAS